METKVIDCVADPLAGTELGAEIIRNGGLVAFPTETVYGLGANGLDGEAVNRIFLAKGRPNDNPLILHVSRKEQAGNLWLEVPPEAEKLMDTFWPGPLTLIFRRAKCVPDEVTAGLDTVAVRMPHNPTALALIEKAGVPVAAPSANLSGKPSPTRAEHVLRDMEGKIPLILDGGPCRFGVESTVLSLVGIPTIRCRDQGDAGSRYRRGAAGRLSAPSPEGRGKGTFPRNEVSPLCPQSAGICGHRGAGKGSPADIGAVCRYGSAGKDCGNSRHGTDYGAVQSQRLPLLPYGGQAGSGDSVCPAFYPAAGNG